VQAGKINKIDINNEGDYILELGDEKDIVVVNDYYMHQHRPQTGGYYVVYEDGYESFSPAKAFEKGYVEIES
jgi:hypothetical protein